MSNPDNPTKCRQLHDGWRCFQSETSAWYNLEEITDKTPDIMIPCGFLRRKLKYENLPAWSKFCPICGTDLNYTSDKLVRECRYHGEWKLNDKRWTKSK